MPDLLVLLTLPLIFAFICIYFRVNFLISIVALFVVPSLWLALKLRKRSTKILIFSLVAGILGTILVDPFATHNHVWMVKSIYLINILGGIPIEQFLWSVSFIFLVTAFYEFFCLKKNSGSLFDKKLPILIVVFAILFTVFVSTNYLSVLVAYIKYIYFLGGMMIFGIPIIIVFYKIPAERSSIFYTAFYFIVLNSVYEFVAVSLCLWSFPGAANYIFSFYFYGRLLPLEEILFFSILGSSGVLSYYLLFDND